MWRENDSVGSMVTPRLRALVVNGTTQPLSLTTGKETLTISLLDPIHMTSVCGAFSFNLLLDIQPCIASIHPMRRVLSESTSDGYNVDRVGDCRRSRVCETRARGICVEQKENGPEDRSLRNDAHNNWRDGDRTVVTNALSFPIQHYITLHYRYFIRHLYLK